MIPEIKMMLINIALIIVVALGLYKSKDYINRLVRKIIKRSSKSAWRFSDKRHKKRIRRIEKKRKT